MTQFAAGVFDALAKPRQLLHVTLAALDFLVEDDPVETLAAFLSFCASSRCARAMKPKRLMCFCTLMLGFLDPLGNLHFLLAGQQRDLAHLLEIHPDRVVQDIELGFGLFLFLLFVGVFLAVLVTIDVRGIDDVDLHPRGAAS